MLHLPNVTVAIIDCKNHAEAITAIRKTLEQITPANVLFFTDKFPHEIGLHEDPEFLAKIEWVLCKINSKQLYSEYVVKYLWRHVLTTHALIIQHDGFVLDGSQWTDEFLQYDYIGALWTYKDGRDVGNGGFSLRSRRLMNVLASDKFITQTHPEDEIIGRLYRSYLEMHHAIKFATEDLAAKFSYETRRPLQPTFGFHNYFWKPYQPRVVIKRSGAMGDIIMMEPVIEHFHKQGKLVFLDIPADVFQLFSHHHYPVYHVSDIDLEHETYEFINLDMTYEHRPKQLALKSYFEFAGITDYTLRNPVLDFHVTPPTRLFDGYVVLHVDDTAMPHRNVHGVDWDEVVAVLQSHGYTVIQVGNGSKRYGTYMRTTTLNMLMYVIGGAEFFIGVDSGPSQIAVALGIKSYLFFGSVDPKFRYHDLSNITVIQGKCPFEKDGCYHEVISVKGQDCEVDRVTPPCISHTTEHVISQIL